MVHVDLKCAKCDQTFTNQELREHVEKGVSCQTCKIELCNNDLLAHHAKLHESYKCDICHKTFDLLKQFAIHVKYDHTKNYACEICDECFDSKSQLFDHKVNMNHSPNNKCACSFCGNQFKNCITLKKHFKFTCKLCGSKFCSKINFNKHMHVRYKCANCDKCFLSHEMLTAHKKENHAEQATYRRQQANLKS